MKNTKNKLNSQSRIVKASFQQVDVAICESSYTAKGWSKPRMLKAMRSVKEYVQAEYLGQKQIVPVYQYVC